MRLVEKGASNHLCLAGRLLEKQPLRYTPSGLPIIEGRFTHHSEQWEAGVARQVECEISFLALGDTAHWMLAASYEANLVLSGFLAAKSRNRKTSVFHVQEVDFLEGQQNGTVFQEERG
ncbi:MAG: primosomal replication protein N [Zoogloeaceae bacterium]|jgi:primosomal replication protein N|nr:primosomal replication protein N [Zoogloeaceae bacterium]